MSLCRITLSRLPDDSWSAFHANAPGDGRRGVKEDDMVLLDNAQNQKLGLHYNIYITFSRSYPERLTASTVTFPLLNTSPLP